MLDAKHIAERYIAVWNEADPERRGGLLREHWNADATYVDPLMQGEGIAQISGLIGAVHERFPGFRFTLDGKPDGYADKLRFSWSLGPESQPDMIQGTDFVIVDGTRLLSVVGFIDKAPAGA